MIMNRKNLELLKKIPVSEENEESSESKRAYQKGIQRFDNDDY